MDRVSPSSAKPPADPAADGQPPHNNNNSNTSSNNTTITPPSNNPPPPAYSASSVPHPSILRALASTLNGMNAHDEDDENEETTVRINMPTSIQGSGNLVTLPQLDGPRVISILISILQGHQNLLPPARGTAPNPQMQAHPQPHPHPQAQPQTQSLSLPCASHIRHGPMTIELHAPITVVGDRNVVGVAPTTYAPRLRTVAAAAPGVPVPLPNTSVPTPVGQPQITSQNGLKRKLVDSNGEETDEDIAITRGPKRPNVVRPETEEGGRDGPGVNAP